MNKTQENLLKAFTGESAARNKYTFFAQRAREEGFEAIARIFEETAGNEMAHAQRLLSFIDGEVNTNVEMGLAPVGTTKDNLEVAIEGEHYENTSMYPDFEKIAKEEGFDKIASVFKEIGEVEEKHEDRYKTILKEVENSSVFKKDREIEWLCLNCGYVHKGKEAPEECPACEKPQSWYSPRGINW